MSPLEVSGAPAAPPEAIVALPNERVYVHPGQTAASAQGATITTILGSCVAVCLFDPVARVGGLNHFLLPRAPLGAPSARFGDIAVPRLIESVCALGALPSRLEAKIIGGACVLDAYRGGPSHIGRSNVRAALEALIETRIVVVTMEVGGDRARRVVFRPGTGDLLIRYI